MRSDVPSVAAPVAAAVAVVRGRSSLRPLTHALQLDLLRRGLLPPLLLMLLLLLLLLLLHLCPRTPWNASIVTLKPRVRTSISVVPRVVIARIRESVAQPVRGIHGVLAHRAG